MIVDKQNDLNVYKEDTTGTEIRAAASACCSTGEKKTAEPVVDEKNTAGPAVAAEEKKTPCCTPSKNATQPAKNGGCCGTGKRKVEAVKETGCCSEKGSCCTTTASETVNKEEEGKGKKNVADIDFNEWVGECCSFFLESKIYAFLLFVRHSADDNCLVKGHLISMLLNLLGHRKLRILGGTLVS